MPDPSGPPLASQRAYSTAHHVVKSASVIGLATFTSRLLGFIRDMVLARLFGATTAADAFFVAYRIPNLLRELLAEGSMSSAVIPVFTEYHTLRTRQEMRELVHAAFTTLVTIVSGLTLLGIVTAPAIVWLLAPGFHGHPGQLALTTLLARLMFPYLLFISLAALAMGILNALRAFAVPALSPVFFNVSMIGCALIVAPALPEPIVGVALGVVAGGAAQFAIQLPGLVRRGMGFGWRFEPWHPGVKRIGALMMPSLLGLSVTQINLTVSTILASFFPGGPTYLFYGMRLIQFPLGIFGTALATAILPTLAAQAARGAFDELRSTVAFGIRMVLFIIVPAMVGLILLRQPIVHLFFEHGSFTGRDTAATATAVLCYGVGLWAFAGVRIIVAAFYSIKDTATPALVAAVAVLANVGCSILLMDWLEAAGLALATASSAMLNVGILLTVLNRRVGGLDWWSVWRSAMRICVATVPVALTCLWVAHASLWAQEAQWGAKAVLLVLGIGMSLTAYGAVHALLRSEELEVVWGLIRGARGGQGPSHNRYANPDRSA
jgi:putative peptidoglycan lipid II flippase